VTISQYLSLSHTHLGYYFHLYLFHYGPLSKVRALSRNLYKPAVKPLPIPYHSWPFWLRSSVVSVLNSLTTIMGALLSILGYLIFVAPVLIGLCLHPLGVMTLPLHYLLVSSGDPRLSFSCTWFASFVFRSLESQEMDWALIRSGPSETSLIA